MVALTPKLRSNAAQRAPPTSPNPKSVISLAIMTAVTMVSDALSGKVKMPNLGLSEVSARFNDGTVTECYACEYIEGKDSTISGAPYCGVSM